AIKRVLPTLSQVPAFASMFVAEARIASRLSHPNIVSVLDLYRDLDGRLLLVMEYVDGTDLASLLESGPLPPSLAIFIAVEMLAHGPLFAGTTREIMGQVLFRAIPAPSSVRSGVPTDLEAVAMRLLARARDERYAAAEAAIAALLACGDAPRDGRGELVQLL